MAGSRWRGSLVTLVGICGAAADPVATADSPYLQLAYWDKLYTAEPKLSSGPLVSSWQGIGYQQLLGILMPILSRMQARRVVVLGAGDSPLPEELSDAGLSDVTAVDFSEEVVRGMRARNGDSRPGLKWLVEDVRKLSFPDDSFSLAIDVGTLDTLAIGEEKDSEEMLKQVRRVLRADGAFISVSSEPPLFRARLLGKHMPSAGWNTSTVSLPRPREIDRRIHDLNPEFQPGQLTVYVVTPIVAGAAEDAPPGAADAQKAEGGEAARGPQSAEAAHAVGGGSELGAEPDVEDAQEAAVRGDEPASAQEALTTDESLREAIHEVPASQPASDATIAETDGRVGRGSEQEMPAGEPPSAPEARETEGSAEAGQKAEERPLPAAGEGAREASEPLGMSADAGVPEPELQATGDRQGAEEQGSATEERGVGAEEPRDVSAGQASSERSEEGLEDRKEAAIEFEETKAETGRPPLEAQEDVPQPEELPRQAAEGGEIKQESVVDEELGKVEGGKAEL